MSECPACGHDNQAGAKFCSECAASMRETLAPAREERKVVTVLFADLVGFTARSEQLDPEDVRAFLNPYYIRLRTELERYGGTVEKFIGDAVMALFGAPVAHEDDPERAVRAALAIRDWMVAQDGEFPLRIGVNTGEVLVALGARPAQGEGMASGDVVNTTARLQTAAPVNGILVGEMTYRATSHVIRYRPADAVTAKGKALPVPAWEALEARSRHGVDVGATSRTPLAGRVREFGVLKDALQRAEDDRSVHLVTLAGVPGIGKSRLVAELFRTIQERPRERLAWRQGRSLPYGEGITFSALSEMVKAQAGILETDTSAEAETKLRASVAELMSDPSDARWVERHLRPLAGLSVAEADSTGGRREESFAAWTRFFAALAEVGPLVLVFEDLHWADDNMLDFVEHIAGWSAGGPLLVLCTARPELLERRTSWGGGMRNSTTLWLTALSDEETSALITSLPDGPVMTAATRRILLDRAGGNPLYAEQFVRVLEERGDGDAMMLPETVQGIIAARLDALPEAEKRLLQSAAVIGKVFWLGAVTQVGGAEPQTAEKQLHALERKDFVLRAPHSSLANESEYSYLHVLVRDVAYGQIPRAQRAEQHLLAAEWLSSLGRVEDNAEMVAHHYRVAIDLRRATGQPISNALAQRARSSLRDAGDRAYGLDAYDSASDFYEAALELAPAGSLDHAQLLFLLAKTRAIHGDFTLELLTAARVELLACGDRETAAEAEENLAGQHWRRGHRTLCFEHLARARELVESSEPSRVKAYVYSSLAKFHSVAEEDEAAIRFGREALEMGRTLGLDRVRARALTAIGDSKVHAGDLTGVADLEHAMAIAVEANANFEFCQAAGNLASGEWERGNIERGFALFERGEELALRHGLLGVARWNQGERVAYSYVLGHWQESQDLADAFLGEVEAGSPHYQASTCYSVRAQVRLGRDDVEGAIGDADRAIALARSAGDPQSLQPALANGAYLYGEAGDPERAGTLADEFLAALQEGGGIGFSIVSLHTLAWTLARQGRGEALLRALPHRDVPWIHAARAFAEGDLRRAADICKSVHATTEEARDRLWLAEDLLRSGLRADAGIELQLALDFYRSVRATRYEREAEALMSRGVSAG